MSPADSEVYPLPFPLPPATGQLCHLDLKVPLVVGGAAVTNSNVDRWMDTRGKERGNITHVRNKIVCVRHALRVCTRENVCS